MRDTVRDVTAEEIIAYVQSRGAYKASVVAGKAIDLTGPRNNRKVICPTTSGLYPLDSAALWCDGVEYASNILRTKRLRKMGAR